MLAGLILQEDTRTGGAALVGVVTDRYWNSEMWPTIEPGEAP